MHLLKFTCIRELKLSSNQHCIETRNKLKVYIEKMLIFNLFRSQTYPHRNQNHQNQKVCAQYLIKVKSSKELILLSHWMTWQTKKSETDWWEGLSWCTRSQRIKELHSSSLGLTVFVQATWLSKHPRGFTCTFKWTWLLYCSCVYFARYFWSTWSPEWKSLLCVQVMKGKLWVLNN